MWYVCDVLYVVLYVCVNCFVVRVCAVSRRYINVCDSDVFSVGNMYLDRLPVGAHGGEVMYFWCFGFRGKLGFIDCDDIYMCVVNKHFELLEFGLILFMLT